MTLTAAQIRPYVQTGLTDPELKVLVDAVYAEIDARIGSTGSRVELLRGSRRIVYLGRPAASIGGVVETTGNTSTSLNANDYRLRPGGYALERLNTGTHPRSWWNRLVEATYTPVDDSDLRDGVAIDLCRLAITYNPGLTSETIGTWTEQYASNSVWNNSKERQSILARLDPDPGVIVVGEPSAWAS